MFEFIKIAWRNLWRNTRRTIIISCAIGLGIWGGIVAVALDNAFVFQMMDNFIYSFLGHIEIHFKGYQKNPSLRLCIIDADRVISLVKEVRHIKSYSPRIKSFGLAQSPRSSQGIMLIGIDPVLESRTTRIKSFIKQGRYFERDDEPAVLIGKELAKKLRLRVGDKLTIFSQSLASEEGVMESLRVVGIYKSGISDLDKSLVYLPIKTAERILEMQGKINEVAIVVDSEKNVPMVKRALKDGLEKIKHNLKAKAEEVLIDGKRTKFVIFKSANNFILDPEIYEEAFKRNSSLKAQSARIYLPITAVFQDKGKPNSLDIDLIGIDPINEQKATGILSKIILPEDSWLKGTEIEKELEVNTDWVILSKSASKKLGAEAGKEIVFDSGDKRLKLRVIGVIEEFYGEQRKDFAIVHRRGLWRNFINRSCASEIWVRLKPDADLDKAKRSLLASIGYEALDWGELYPTLAQLYSLMNAMNYVLLLVIYIAVAFGIANTMIMSVFERVREFGILKAIGTKPFQLFMMVIFESIMLAVLGMILGGLASGVTVFIWARRGLDLSMFASGMEALGLGTVLYPVLTLENIVGAVVMAVLIAIISAIYPAYRASRLLVVEALRHY